ncbi:MAG: type II toxin-antitoxin system Phd/YefM family antitoxin [Opitutales bacterium]
MWTMKTATLRQLRNETSLLAKWVAEGETVVVTKRSKPLFRLITAAPETAAPCPIPDFEARQREIFPEGVLSQTGAELIAEERDRY